MFAAENLKCGSGGGSSSNNSSSQAVVGHIITCAVGINEVTASRDTVRSRTVGKEVNAPTIFIRVAQVDAV